MPSSASWRIRGHQPDGGDGDAARGHAEPVGGRVGEAAYGADDGLVVGQRLAHAHEHDVGDAAGAAGHLAAGQRPGAGDHLLDDLGGGHVALQPALAGGAERAGHAAAGLAGDAHRGAVGVAHQHRLDERAVEEPPQRLAGGARGRPRGCAAASSASAGTPRPAGPALGGRQVGHLGGVVDQPGEVVGGELLGAERRQAVLGRQRRPLVGGRGRRGGAAACRGRAARRRRAGGRGDASAARIGRSGLRSPELSTTAPQHEGADPDHHDAPW